MRRQTFHAAVATAAIILSAFGQMTVSALEVTEDSIKSLDITVDIRRDGKVEVEQDFVLSLSGNEIKRGPILSYLTVYQGLGGLILDHKMEVHEVLRNGVPEPFSVHHQGGVAQITCGKSDVFLEEKEQRYTIRFSRNADWSFRDGAATWAYEITESFKNFRIEQLNFELRLPEGVAFEHVSPGLSGSEATGTGYKLAESPGIMKVSTTAALRPQAFMFVNASWKSASFATQSQWLEVLRQHPKLPMAGFSAILLCFVLILLLTRLLRKYRFKPASVN